jgi:hypothetical protein
VISSSPLIETKEFSYFEVEIAEMGNPDTKIAIGFCNKVDFNKSLLPGMYANSVGVHSNSLDADQVNSDPNAPKGDIYANGKIMALFGFSCKFGETIGSNYSFTLKI